MAIHIKEVLKSVIKKEDKLFQKKEEIINILKNVLEKKILDEVKNAKIYRNNLLIFVSSSACLYELNLRKKQILDEIKKNLKKIENVKFKLIKYER